MSSVASDGPLRPWLAGENEYAFNGPEGKASLIDLFQGRACPGCSMVADHVGHLAHLNTRDTTLVFCSRAPQAEIVRLKARMPADPLVHRRRAGPAVVIAHIGGVPAEEVLLALAGGLGAGLLLKLSSLALHVRLTASFPHRRAPQDRLDRDSPQPVRRIAD